MRILYLDCFSGISGDMALASLVDAGADQQYIENELQKIEIEPFRLVWETVIKKGISALKMEVAVPPEHHPKHHRHYADIIKLIESCGFSEEVTRMSLHIFEKIGKAEGKIHQMPLDKVHFHEVGAIDSIVDTIGVALAIDSLQIDQIWSSPIPLGSGHIHCDHGIYPVPAPATLEMMKGIPLASTAHAIELTTPTGAGIISALVEHFSDSIPAMKVEAVGYGAGTKDLPNHPNVLRSIVGTLDHQPSPSIGHTHLHDHPHTAHVNEHEHNHRSHRHC